MYTALAAADSRCDCESTLMSRPSACPLGTAPVRFELSIRQRRSFDSQSVFRIRPSRCRFRKIVNNVLGVAFSSAKSPVTGGSSHLDSTFQYTRAPYGAGVAWSDSCRLGAS